MDCGGDPTLPPPAKSPKLLNPTTTIDSLGDDILLDIFLLLPSLASLIRAALTCQAWRRAVASSRAFRHRFRELHPAPLLGLVTEPQKDALPSFAPAQRRDRDVLAAIRGGDFSLTFLLDPNDYACDAPPLHWHIHDCQDGFLLLMNWDAGLLATVNPLALQFTDYIEMPIDRKTGPPQPGVPTSLDVHLICSDEDPMSFRLVWLFYMESAVQVAVFSSGMGWFFHPLVDIAERAPPHNAGEHWLHFGLQSNGVLYWPFKNMEHVLKLDTKTMEFSVLKLPPNMDHSYSFVVGETMNGTLWVVYCTGWSIDVFRYDGVDRWISAGQIQYEIETDPPADNDTLCVVTMKDGFAYFATPDMILFLCLETMALDTLIPRSFRARHFHPYIMAWPPCLVLGNYGSFAEIQDGANEPKECGT
ncbi:hypothetical protein EJB05_53529, partial [Eragrostis curvula]